MGWGRTALVGLLVTQFAEETGGSLEPSRLDRSVEVEVEVEVEVYALRFQPVESRTRMPWSGQVRPKGASRLLGPLITWMGVRQEQRTWAASKRHLEDAPTGAL